MKKDPEKNRSLHDVEILKAKVSYRKAEKSYNKLKSDGKFEDTCNEVESNENRLTDTSNLSEMNDNDIYKQLERPNN